MWDIRGFWHSCSCSSSPPASPPSWPPCPPTPPPRPTRMKWSSSPRPCSPGSWAGRRDWSRAGRLQLRPGRSELWGALGIDSNASMQVLTPGVAMVNFQQTLVSSLRHTVWWKFWHPCKPSVCFASCNVFHILRVTNSVFRSFHCKVEVQLC